MKQALWFLFIGLLFGCTEVNNYELPSDYDGGTIIVYEDEDKITPQNADDVNNAVPSNEEGDVNVINVNVGQPMSDAGVDDNDAVDETPEEGAVDAETEDPTEIEDAGVPTEEISLVADQPAPDAETNPSIVFGGTKDVIMGKFRFFGRGKELRVDKMHCSASNPRAITALYLYVGNTLVATVDSFESGWVDIHPTGFIVPKDGAVVLSIRGDMALVGPAGVPTGTYLQVFCSDDSGSFQATSTDGTTTITDFGHVLLTTYGKELRKSKPTVFSVTPLINLVNGTNSVMRFGVTADLAGDVAMKGFVAKMAIDLAGEAMFGPADIGSGVRRLGEASGLPGSASFQSEDAMCGPSFGPCEFIFKTEFTSEEVIAAGTTRIYEIQLNVQGVQPGDSITTRFAPPSEYRHATGELDAWGIPLGLYIENALPPYGRQRMSAIFVWSDMSAVPHNDTKSTMSGVDDAAASDDWTNEGLLNLRDGFDRTIAN